MTDYRRKANSRWTAAMSLTSLMRVHLGRYRTYAGIAAHAGVTELTARNWFTRMREDYGVQLGRDDRGVFRVVEWGCFDKGRVMAWLGSGHAFAGALDRGEFVAPGYVPELDMDWGREPEPGVREYRYTEPVVDADGLELPL